MSGRGLGSAYLWTLNKNKRKATILWEEFEMNVAYIKALEAYGKEVCAWCPQVFCEDVDKLELCYNNFEEKAIE